jgi:hypothetical protein
MNLLLLLPLLLVPLGYWLVVMAISHHPVAEAAVVVEKRPPSGFTPLTASVLLDGRLKPRHLQAAVLDLHQRGGLAMREDEDGVTLLARRPEVTRPDDRLLARVVFDGSASVTAAEAGGRLHEARHALAALCEETLSRCGLVRDGNWRVILQLAFGLALTAAVIALVHVRFGFLTGLAVGFPLLVMAQFAYMAATCHLPLTATGHDTLGHLEGYRRHLLAVADGRAELDGSLDEHLSYAVAFEINLPLPDAAEATRRLLDSLWS